MEVILILIKTAATWLFLSSLFAANLSQFEDRFEFVRDENGTLQTVRDNSIITKISIAPYVRMLKMRLLSEQELMNRKSFDYDEDIRKLFSENTALDHKDIFSGANNYSNKMGYRYGRRKRNEENLIKSLRSLQDIRVDEVFLNPKFNTLLGEFESRLSSAFEVLDLRIIANLNNSTFFYKKKVAHRVVEWGLSQAKKRFSSLPVLNTISYVMVQLAELVSENRQFRQNMLLHFLENVSEDDLGLTASEVNRIMSSIYESRIAWTGYFESRNAQKDWETYGVNRFYASIRLANNRFRGNPHMGELGTRLNFAFQESMMEKGKVIYNLFHTDHQFSSKPALAFDFSRPNFVKRKRMVVKLAELGVSFLTLPSWIKSSADTFLKSMYKQQELSEGSLFAYFSMEDDTEGMNLVRRQFFNPFANL